MIFPLFNYDILLVLYDQKEIGRIIVPGSYNSVIKQGQKNTHLMVATLLRLTFTAAFIIPGGYEIMRTRKKEKGIVRFVKQVIFMGDCSIFLFIVD